MKNGSLIFTGMFTLAAGIFLTIAWREWGKSAEIMARGVETEGIVVETLRRKLRTNERTAPGEAPVVQFTTQLGEVKKYASTLYTNPCAYQPGERVRIWYLPGDPERATLGGKDAWVLPGVFGAFGLAVSLIAVYGWVRFFFGSN